jgi:putative FmdB family regulatory protein
VPIYEYQCVDCGHRLEKIQKFSDDPLKDCPECGQSSLQKLISAAGFRLKGGGWYETDFKSGGKRNLVDDGKSETSSNKSSGGSDEPSSKGTAAKKSGSDQGGK